MSTRLLMTQETHTIHRTKSDIRKARFKITTTEGSLNICANSINITTL